MIRVANSVPLTDSDPRPWPPEDPSDYRLHLDPDDDEHELVLPTTPWTYENGSVNPNLEPSNARRRGAKRAKKSQKDGFISNVPPYHPDYVDPSSSAAQAGYETSSTEDSDENRYAERGPGHRVRRGSEGYEIKPADREEILRRYILSRGDEVGHYRRYTPEPDTDNESSNEKDSDEDIPLGAAA